MNLILNSYLIWRDTKGNNEVSVSNIRIVLNIDTSMCIKIVRVCIQM